MIRYIIIGCLLVAMALDVFLNNDIIKKIFMFGLADPSKYDGRKFRIIHFSGCLVAVLLLVAGIIDGRPLWTYLLLIEVIVLFVLIFSITKK